MSIFKKSDLDKWFNEEKWVDVSRPKKDGGFEECGRSNADKGKYPVCTPASKARTLDEKERKNRIKAKRKNEKKKTTAITKKYSKTTIGIGRRFP